MTKGGAVSLEAIAKAAWKTDPGFQAIAKHLYGDDVALEDILDDVAKMDPAPADVHVPGKGCSCAKCKKVEKWKGQPRDRHSGQFISGGKQGLRTAGEIAAAGVLGGAAAAATFKAPGMAAHVGQSAKATVQGAEHIGETVKDAAKLVGVAGGGLVAGVGAQENAQAANRDLKAFARRKKKDDAVVKMLATAVSKNLVAPEVAVETAREYFAKRTKEDQEKLQNRVALASNAVGIAAGTAAIGAALKNPALRRATATAEHAGPISGKLMNRLKTPKAQRRAIQAGAGAALGLQAANVGGDVVANRVLSRANEKTKKNLDVTWEGEFSKVDDEKRQVFGWASVVEINGEPVVDLQGDYIHPTEMERAAYEYVLKSRVGGDMHSRVDEQGNKIEKADRAMHVSDMIESVVFTPEKIEKMGLPPGSLPTGWWVGFKVNDDEVWKSVKSGERKGFSIHGLGARMEKRYDEIGKNYDNIVQDLIEKAYEYAEDEDDVLENLYEIHDRLVNKTVGTQNRSGSTGQRQEAYTNHYLQQATAMMAPQVAQHIQQLQIQREQQAMMEASMLQQAPQAQNWQTLNQMGPQGPAQHQQGPRMPAVSQGPSGPAGPSSPF